MDSSTPLRRPRTTGGAVACVAVAALLATTVIPLPVGAGSQVFLVADVNSERPGLTPSELAAVGGGLLFAGADGIVGTELWKVDAGSGEAMPVRDIAPGGASSSPVEITDVGGVAFFTADDTVHGVELWRSDGTEAGTLMIEDIRPGSEGSDPRALVAAGGVLFFEAGDGVHGRELWRSDGTAAGTFMVDDIDPGEGDGLGLWWDEYYTSDLTALGGSVYFAADDGVHGWELWKSDGTSSGTVMVEDINGGAANSLTDESQHFPDLEAVGSTLFVMADDGSHGFELWRSDGTAAGTDLVYDIAPGPLHALWSFPYASDLTASGSYVYFVTVNNGDNDWAVWRSDGTASGTIMVLDTWNPSGEFTDVGGTLYFVDWDWKLWRSDGSVAGTTSVGNGGFSLTNVAGTLFFVGSDGELWMYRAASGSTRVEDIYPGTGKAMPLDQYPWWLTAVGSTLYFMATDGAHGYELWRSDGSAAGTDRVPVSTPVTLSSSPEHLVGVGSVLFFGADDGNHGFELWRSDGTASGTALVTDIQAGPASSRPSELVGAGGVVFFTADDGAHGSELWRSDGTAAGTSLVADVDPGVDGANPRELTVVDGVLFFEARDDGHGYEVWRSDGTAAGTTLVADLNPGTGGSGPDDLTALQGLLYFTADDGAHGSELWRSDGTAAGTSMVLDINPGPGDGIEYWPAWLVAAGSKLFFVADDGVHGSELWQTDGTAAGTAMVKDVMAGAADGFVQLTTAAGDEVYFTASDGLHGDELWTSDGTEAGTGMVSDIVPGAGSSSPSDLVVLGDSVVFSADDGVSGRELWKSDGTAAGTTRLADLRPGPNGSAISSMTRLGSLVYFAASDGTAGKDLYRLAPDGAITRVVIGSGGSWPRDLTAVGDDLYLVARDGIHGEELWLVANRPPVVLAAGDVMIDEGQTAIMTGTFGDADGDPVVLSSDRGLVTVTGDGTWEWRMATSDGPTESSQVTVTATDAAGSSVTSNFMLDVLNVAPAVVEPWADPPDGPRPLGAPVPIEARFTDPGSGDSHSATWDWGDGTTSVGVVDPEERSVQGTHTYAAAGIYVVTLTVTDDDGGVGWSAYEELVVYDPAAGFVSGAGWIESPAGAYAANPIMEGRASFAFVSRYVKKQTAPIGTTQFRFAVAGLEFASSGYEWLIVTGGDYARFKGVGSVNGSAGYRFQIWAGDDTPDTFRIRIWTEDESGVEEVLYDNGADQPIGGGQVIVHTASG